MRKKIAKRLRRQLLRAGCTIKREEFISEPGWRRKDCGVSIEFSTPDGWTVTSLGFDSLEAYRLALWCLEDPITSPDCICSPSANV